MTDIKSTHSDSAAAGPVTPAGGTNMKRPLDKKQIGATPDTSVAAPVTVFPSGQINKEDLDILFAGTELSEDFQSKAFTLFEGAVSAKVSAITEGLKAELEESYVAQLDEAVEDITEKVSDYLQVFVETYLKENELAIENGIKAEIAESVLVSLRNIFEEHNVEIPEDKVDIVESLTDRVTELEEELNESIKASVASKKLIESFQKAEILKSLTEGLDDVSKERLVKLTEHVTFDSAEAFTTSVNVLKESLVPGKVVKTTELNESVSVATDSAKTETLMDKYIQTARAFNSSL